GLFCMACAIPLEVGALLVGAWALLPQTYEVWASATNLQWVAGVSVLLMLALPDDALDARRHRWTAWALVCGLSGIPAVIAAPVFLVRGWRERARGAFSIGIALSACALLHAWIVATTPLDEREFDADLLLIVVPFFLQSVLSPLFGGDFSTALG